MLIFNFHWGYGFEKVFLKFLLSIDWGLSWEIWGWYKYLSPTALKTSGQFRIIFRFACTKMYLGIQYHQKCPELVNIEKWDLRRYPTLNVYTYVAFNHLFIRCKYGYIESLKLLLLLFHDICRWVGRQANFFYTSTSE